MSATSEIPVPTIPIPTSTTSSSVVPITNENHSATLLHSPASSAKSFTTACTSTEGQNHVNTRHSPISLPPPQSLRRSVSVDSFSRESSRAGRSCTLSAQNSSQNLVHSLPLESLSGPEKQIFSVGHRGESLSTVYLDQDSSPLESDTDRYDPLTISSTERFRHLSFKNQEKQKPLVRGGELPLPSRAQQNTSLPPLHTTNFSTIRPPLASHASFDSSKRGNSYSSFNSGRSRSGSLGINVANSLTRIATTVSEYPHRNYLMFYLTISTAVLPSSGKTHCCYCHRHIKLWKINCHSQGSFWIGLNGFDFGFWAYTCIRISSLLVAPLYPLITSLIVNV